MEILIFALIASYNGHRQQERVVAEPEEFQPFDLQALRTRHCTRRARRPRYGLRGHLERGVGDAYFEDTEALHGYMPPYAALDQADLERVRAAIRTFIAERCDGDTVEFRTPVLIAIGYRI